MYFRKYKLAIEIDEKGHTDWPKTREEEKEKHLRDQLGCKIIRINPNAEDYDIFTEIGEIHNHIIEST